MVPLCALLPQVFSFKVCKASILQVAFKTDSFKLEGNTVTLNGEATTLPMHKTYKDGSEVKIEDIGEIPANYTLILHMSLIVLCKSYDM